MAQKIHQGIVYIWILVMAGLAVNAALQSFDVPLVLTLLPALASVYYRDYLTAKHSQALHREIKALKIAALLLCVVLLASTTIHK